MRPDGADPQARGSLADAAPVMLCARRLRQVSARTIHACQCTYSTIGERSMNQAFLCLNNGEAGVLRWRTNDKTTPRSICDRTDALHSLLPNLAFNH